MRLLFICQECSTHYLPPEGLEYSDGEKASPVWCSECQGIMRARGVPESEVAAAVAMLAAKAALRLRGAAGHEEPTAPHLRPSAPARTSRVRPAGARTKLT